ncbi:MAG: hypothetical protein E6Q91_02420 [Actinobacteria bacterium]|nr:MAG: hypothetical protein E6Q91_02420 [Actinomycetota bacterium]
MSQQPPPPAYGYGQPQPQPQTSSDAIVALVLAILSWAVCPFVLAIVALIFASKASKAIAASNGWLDGAGMVTAARVIAWINIAIGILFVGFLIVAVIIGAFSTELPTDLPTGLPTDASDFDALMRVF